MVVLVVHCVVVRDHQERALLKQDHLVCPDGVAEAVQTLVQLVDVWEEDADDLRPRLVEGLIPNGGAEALCLLLEVVRSCLHDAGHLFSEHFVSLVLPNQVHLVDQYKDSCVLREVSKRIQAVLVVLQIDIEFFGGDIEDKNEDANVLENVVSL